VELNQALDFVKDDDPRTKLAQADNAAYIPAKKLFLVVDKEAVIKNRAVEPEDYGQIVDTLKIDLTNKHYLTKDELMVLDMIAHNNWKRPLYFAITVGRDKYINLQDYFQLEGLGYRLVPIKTKTDGLDVGRVDTKDMYVNMMEKFKWGNMNDPKVYIDENNARMMMNIQSTFSRLAQALVAEGKNDKAIKVLDHCNELIPNSIVPYGYFAMTMADTYFKAGQAEKGKEMINTIMNNLDGDLSFYLQLDRAMRNSVDDDIQRDLYFMREMTMICTRNNQPELQKAVSDKFNNYFERYSSLK
jgi:hypothetical protein